jgi:hypothetical protein
MDTLEKEAIAWVKGREADCLRRRVYEALRTAEEAGTTEEWEEYDPEVWAEELQLYSSDLEGVSVGVLSLLIEEYREETEND